MEENRALTRKEMGRYLRYYRQRCGMTAAQMAEALGYKSQQSVYNVESGQSSLDPGRRFAFLAACSVDPDDAFREDFGVVDDPSRAKPAGSKRVRELEDVFMRLDEEAQATILRTARWALAAQEAALASQESLGESG